jgi:hypothetical protein
MVWCASAGPISVIGADYDLSRAAAGATVARVFKRRGDYRIVLEGGQPAPEDLRLLDLLRGEHGADLSRPRNVRLFMFFPSEALAFEAGKLLHSGRFNVVGLEPSGPDERWGVRAEGRLQVDHVNVADFRGRFEGVARSFGGTLERWEASATP